MSLLQVAAVAGFAAFTAWFAPSLFKESETMTVFGALMWGALLAAMLLTFTGLR